ncbi:MAG TPA: hypothetical protein VFU97_24465 [Xanthobacteraceae bacterium]|nr:hypothetical protein [Xanthobacteraceae bacterium]
MTGYDDTKAFLSYIDALGGVVLVSVPASTGIPTVVQSYPGQNAQKSVCLFSDRATSVVVGFGAAGATPGHYDFRFAWYSTATASSLIGPIQVLADKVEIPTSAAGIVTASTPSGAAKFLIQRSPTLGRSSVTAATVTSGGSVTIDKTLALLNLQSKPFAHGSAVYALLGFDSDTQGDVFTVLLSDPVSGASFVPVGRHAPRESGTTYFPLVASVVSTGPHRFLCPLIVKTLIQRVNTQEFLPVSGVDLFELDFGSDPAIDPRGVFALGPGRTAFASAWPAYHDGACLNEVAFAYGPESDDAAVSVSAGLGGMAAGDYLYVFLYRASDNARGVMRSVVSTPVKATIVNPGDVVNITPGALSLVNGFQYNQATIGPARAVACDIYRTLVNESGPFHYVASVDALNPTTFVDTQQDLVIQTNPTVYTDGGVLDNVPPAPARSVVIAQSRVFFAYRHEVWYSKLFIAGETPGFNEQLVVAIDDDQEITALSSLDGRPVVFTERSMYVLDGDGFDDQGGGSNYTPRKLTAEVGCADPRSIVTTGDGIFYFAEPGIHILDRSLDVQFIGQPVKDEVLSFPILVSAVHVPNKKRVLFFLRNEVGENRIISYDYNRRQWATWTNDDDTIAAAALSGSELAYLTTTGKLRMSDDAVWTDASVPYEHVARTAWIKLGQLQGYQQVRRATFLLDRIDDAGLSISVYHDYNDTQVNEGYTWTAADLRALPRPEVSIHLRRQKCESIAFGMSDTAPGTAGAAIVGVVLELEMKRGSSRLLLDQTARK